MSKKTIIYLSVITIVIGTIFLANGLILAWTAPTASPPDDNVDAPLNVSPIGQVKSGGLLLNAGTDEDNSGAIECPNSNDICEYADTGLIVEHGKVGIGTTNPEGKLHIWDSATVTGQSLLQVGAQNVLWDSIVVKAIGDESANIAADVNAILSVGDYSDVNTASIVTTGRVGIGTPNPAQKLHVAGIMKQQRITYRSIVGGIGGYPQSKTWDLFDVDQNGGFIIEWISGYPSNSYYYYKRWFAKTGSVSAGNLQSIVLEAVGSAPGLVLELSVVGGKVRLMATITNSNNVWGTPQGTIAVRALYGEL